MSATKVHNAGHLCNQGQYFDATAAPSFVLENISIDSLKLRLPRDLVTVTNSDLIDPWELVNIGSGNIDESKRREGRLSHLCAGFSVSYGIDRMNVEKSVQEFVTIGIPSKLLGDRYFEGITSDNVGLIHQALMAQGVVKFSEYDLREKSDCTDIDFKTDSIFTGDFKKFLREIEANVKPSKYTGKGCRTFAQKENQGIQFSTRETTSFQTNPFLKIYHKGRELMYQSNRFAGAHLRDIDYSDIVRMETTVKNRKHVKMLWGVNKAPFEILLKLEPEEKRKAFQHAISAHLLKAEGTRPRHPEKLSGKDVLLFNLVMERWTAGKTFGEIIDLSIEGIDNKVERYRQKKHMEKICKLCETERLKMLHAHHETTGKLYPFEEHLRDYLQN